MKDVLVLVGAPPAPLTPVEIATRLAFDSGARLTALLVPRPIEIPSFALHVAGPSLRDELVRDSLTAVEQLRQQIAPMVAPLRSGFEWIEADAEGLGRHTHSADLVVVGRGDNDDPFGPKGLASLIFNSGRPFLVIPPGIDPGRQGRRMTIGWNGSREAARAVHDALPLLARAEAVELVIVAEGKPAASEAGYGETVRSHLARHGVAASVKVVSNDLARGVDGILLASALEHRSDLLVMGAFGRSRLRELMGGVTASILHNTTVALLLSH